VGNKTFKQVSTRAGNFKRLIEKYPEIDGADILPKLIVSGYKQWTDDERQLFFEGLKIHGRQIGKI